jgi:hypothetical protein
MELEFSQFSILSLGLANLSSDFFIATLQLFQHALCYV